MAGYVAAHRLEALATQLHPARAPWYVRHPVGPGLERTFPASGWYWIPAGADAAVYLGPSYELSCHALRGLVSDLEAASG